MRPATGRMPAAADRGTRGLRPPPKKNTLILAAGGAGLLLVLIVGIYFGLNSGNGGGGPKKSNGTTKNGGAGPSTTNRDNGEPAPPDETWREQPRSTTVPKLQAEMKEKGEAFPADLTALSDADLNALFDEWTNLWTRIAEDEYAGYPPKTHREDNEKVKWWRGKVIDERRRREEKPKE